MDDLISRQAAIDAMMKLQAEDIEAYGASIPEGFDGDRAVTAIKALPSAQQWIPCDKGEPDEDMECWVTVKTTDTLILLGRYNNPAANKVVFDYLNSQSARACRQNRLDWRAHRANEAKNHPPLRA